MIFVAMLLLAAQGRVYEIKGDAEVVLYHKGSLTLKLGSNATTGYSWTLELKKESYLECSNLDGTYYPPEKQIPGAGGYELFELKCREGCVVGHAEEIKLRYSRPWEADSVSVRTIIVRISDEANGAL